MLRGMNSGYSGAVQLASMIPLIPALQVTPMNSRICLSLALAGMVLPGLTLSAQENNQPPQGFTALFNGTDLSGWYGQRDISPCTLAGLSRVERAQMMIEDQPDMLQHWTVADGELVNDGAGVFLSSDREFRDYELWIDYKTVAQADSGIYLKACPQIQIWDTTEAGGKWNIGADKGSGGMWNNSPGSPGKDPLVHADKPFGEWNRFRILQIGQRTTVWLNGELVVDDAIMENNHWNKGHPLPAAGPIWLQTHGGEIRWRNIFLREIGVAEANEYLTRHEGEGFEAAFNGKDFDGWSGPTSQYEVVDGALRCRPNQGGTIYTDREYDNFTACFEFRLPEGGNNGLAIRYPGQGDTAYVGMCELQVLDNTSPKYATLDARQYHGSAYGMVAAERGYLRPPGQWNFQKVTVQGSKIVVELNGSIILDTDLADVTEFMAGSAHPGKDRTSGHFGFAGHGDPVEFRNIRIKPL
jgi:hypothetical protein